MEVVNKILIFFVKQIKPTPINAYPKIFLGIFKKQIDRISTEAGGITGITPVMNKIIMHRIILADACAISTQPYIIFIIPEYCPNIRAAYSCLIGRVII